MRIFLNVKLLPTMPTLPVIILTYVGTGSQNLPVGMASFIRLQYYTLSIILQDPFFSNKGCAFNSYPRLFK